MRIHRVPFSNRNRVVVFENAVKVVDGDLGQLRFDYDDNGHDCIDVFLHPSRAAWFIENFMPSFAGMQALN